MLRPRGIWSPESVCCLLVLSSLQAAAGWLGQALPHRLHTGQCKEDPEPRIPGKGWIPSSNELKPGSSDCTNWKDVTKATEEGKDHCIILG